MKKILSFVFLVGFLFLSQNIFALPHDSCVNPAPQRKRICALHREATDAIDHQNYGVAQKALVELKSLATLQDPLAESIQELSARLPTQQRYKTLPATTGIERNRLDSSVEPRRFSLSINPLGLFAPVIEIELGVYLAPHFRLNLDPVLASWFYGSNSLKYWVIGGTLSGSIFIEPYTGWYIQPGAVYLRSLKTGSDGYLIGGQLIGGYEHTWDSGLFVNFGFGFGAATFPQVHTNDLFHNKTFPYVTTNTFIGKKF